MRRKIQYVKKPKQKAFWYSLALLILVIYGIPRIPQIHPGISGTFSFLWILFAAIMIAANLYFLIGADKERSKMLEERTVAQTESVQNSRGERRRAY